VGFVTIEDWLTFAWTPSSRRYDYNHFYLWL